MENYLYFAEAVVETGDGGFASPSEALMVPASSYIGADPNSATATHFRFANSDGDDSNVAIIKVTHTTGKNKEVIKAMLRCINAEPTTGFVVVIDEETGTAVNKSANINPVFNGLGVSGISIVDDNVDGAIIGVSGGTTLWYSYGAGVHGTDATWARPRYYKYREQGIIITKILIDLTGLACKGDAANDVIGLAAGGAAYIMKYVQRETGLLFKAEVACLEVPGQGTATITTDIDLAFNTSATLAYDGAAGTAEINTGGLAHIGDGFSGVMGVSAPAADDYLYLVEGDTAATTGVYNAGKVMITLYGHEDFGA